eukprot:TRINITY_DN7114_c0_g1_i1.p1 TRINITY_DN7114_c0_g1~~TRINITY_DN7114_c0_g1_i1.p1  ORF type:complete len:260 (+),score=111.29 TRINITY_DN7114_c0_g1_i1:104-883(+)
MDLLMGYADDEDNKVNEEELENKNNDNEEVVKEIKKFIPEKKDPKGSFFNLPPPKKIQTINLSVNTTSNNDEEDEDDLKAKRFKMERENQDKPKSFKDLLPKPKKPTEEKKSEEIVKEDPIVPKIILSEDDIGPSVPSKSDYNNDWEWYREVNEEEPDNGSISDKFNPWQNSVSNKSNFKEITQNDLLDKSYEEKVYGKHYAQYFDRSNPHAMPSVVAKRRHQISALAYEHHANQVLMDERKTNAKKTKNEVKSKYGWL